MDGRKPYKTDYLSTATDIGVPYVDEVFGWVLLGVGKAVNGPALFDKRLTLGEPNVVINLATGSSHDTVERGAFAEENSQFGLTADKKRYNQTSALLGLRLGKSVNWSNGSKMTFQGYVTQYIGFKKQDLSFEAAYSGLSNARFKVEGIGLSKNSTWAGIGVLTEVNPKFAWYVNYDAKMEKSKLNNNVFTTGFRFNF